MAFSKEQLKMLQQLDVKERVLAELIVWLKAKGLYEQASKDIQGLPKEKV